MWINQIPGFLKVILTFSFSIYLIFHIKRELKSGVLEMRTGEMYKKDHRFQFWLGIFLQTTLTIIFMLLAILFLIFM